MSKDRDFYNNKQHPPGGTEMIVLDGVAYKRSQVPDSLIQLKDKSIKATAAISTPSRKKPSSKTQVDKQGEKLERLISLKNERTRLKKQLDNLDRIIEALENE